ncbi:MAG: hypothetical protein WC421_03735 [Elusimicrobiales bacterium]
MRQKDRILACNAADRGEHTPAGCVSRWPRSCRPKAVIFAQKIIREQVYYEFVAQMPGFQQLYQIGQVPHMHFLLRNHLRHKQRKDAGDIGIASTVYIMYTINRKTWHGIFD